MEIYLRYFAVYISLSYSIWDATWQKGLMLYVKCEGSDQPKQLFSPNIASLVVYKILTAPDKVLLFFFFFFFASEKYWYFLFLNKNIYCGYSFELRRHTVLFWINKFSDWFYSYFSTKTYIVDTYLNCLTKMLHLSATTYVLVLK